MSETKQELPDGTRKVIHTAFDVIKLDARIKNADGNPIGKTGKGVKLVFDNGFGAKTVQMPEGKFQGNALKVPRNKQLWADLNQEGLEEDEPVTVTMIKDKGYWDIERIQLGHVGTPGLVRDASEQASSSAVSQASSGGGYNPVGPIVGQIVNIAVAMLQADKSVKAITIDAIKAKTLEIMPEFTTMKAELEATYNGVASKTSKAKAAADEDDEDGDPAPEPSEDEEDFDDVPF